MAGGEQEQGARLDAGTRPRQKAKGSRTGRVGLTTHPPFLFSPYNSQAQTGGKRHDVSRSRPDRPVQVTLPFCRPTPSGRFCVTVALTLAAGFLAAACSGSSQARPGGAPAAGQGRGGGRGGDGGPVPVVTATAVTKSVPITETAVGTVEAISTVQVRSQVTGRLAKVHFAEGQEVQAGQPLFTLDPQPFQVALDQATAVLARDTAQADNAQAQVIRLKNLLDRGLIAARAVRDAAGHRRGAQGDDRRRPRRGGGGRAEPAVHADRGARGRPHRARCRCTRAIWSRPTVRHRWS